MIHKNLLEAIGKNIREARNEKGMIGYTLGKALDVDKSYISQMENGLVDFRISQLYLIADVLETDVCSLVSVNTIHTQKEFKNISKQQKTIFIDTVVIEKMLSRIAKLERAAHKD